MSPKPPASMTVLTVAPEPALAEAFAERLALGGLSPVQAGPCHMLVREAVRLAPQAVVLVVDAATRLDEAVLQALRELADSAPRPVLLVGGPWTDEETAEALAVGVQEFVDAAADPAAIGSLLPRAAARFERDRRLRQALADAEARLDQRKWVDRAKGLLMKERHLSEPDAFALLRSASMQANLRVGEVSRAMIEAAEAADAVNRAGQLRMLSQRLVKVLALRHLGVERLAATSQQLESVQRADGIVESLAALHLDPACEALRVATARAWGRLRDAVEDAASSRADLGALDRLAQALLENAERLTQALQAVSGRPTLQIVNLSGRQRMLSQRVAKQALLARCLTGAQAQAAAEEASASIGDFESALTELEQSPLGGEEIRGLLAVARGQWLRLLQGVRSANGRDGRVAVARESEMLLDSFERLTSTYEHSMQVLLG